MDRGALFPIILFLLAFHAYALDISPGDSLKDIMASVAEDDYAGKDDLGLWPENEYHVYNLEGDGRVFLAMNYYPFAVLTNREGSPVFLIDFDGDSLLDFQTGYLYIPPWVVSLNSTGPHSGEFMLDYLDLTTGAFQSDELPQETEDLKNRTQKLLETARNGEAEDRVYVYYDYLYNYLYSRGEYESAYYCLQNLFKSLNSPPNETILIYMVELAYRSGQIDQSKGLDNILLEYFPDFVPGLVYRYILEENGDRRDEYKKTLLEEHPGHWMVREKVK